VPNPRPDDQESGADQHRPEDQQTDIEAADEHAQGCDDLRAALSQSAGDRGEYGEGREPHHIVGDLKHDSDEGFDAVHDRPTLFADRREGDPEE